jgi:hypothetical protein
MSLKSSGGKLRERTTEKEAKNKNYTVNRKEEKRGKIGGGVGNRTRIAVNLKRIALKFAPLRS